MLGSFPDNQLRKRGAMPYNGANIYSARVGLPIEPEQPNLLSPRYGTAHMRRTPYAPRDYLPFVQHKQLHTDDSWSFGGYSGRDFLRRDARK